MKASTNAPKSFLRKSGQAKASFFSRISIPRTRPIINFIASIVFGVYMGTLVPYIMRNQKPLDGRHQHQTQSLKSQKPTRLSPPPKSLPTKSVSTESNWTSPHLIDCKEIATALESGGDTGVFLRTKTKPSFLMNIYDPSSDIISREIKDKGCWECSRVKDMLQALDYYKGSYLLDIGGNIGMWSLAAAAAKHQTYTIEAMPDSCKRFCKSVNRNSFHDHTHLMNIVATDKPGRYGWAVPKGGNMGGTIVYEVGDIDDPFHRSKIGQDMAGVTIDSLDFPTDVPVVVKVDVEGHELQVLSGATQFLENANIVYALMEFRSNLHIVNLQQRGRWRDILKLLKSKGLTPYRINDEFEGETELDVERLEEWKAFKHPDVRFYDVVWRREDFLPLPEFIPSHR